MRLSIARGVAGIAALIALGIGTQPAFADDAGWYLGFGAGRSLSRLDYDRLARELSAADFDAPTLYPHNRDTAYKGFGGYQFSRNFALEGSYFDLGKFGFPAPAAAPGVLDGGLRVRGYGVDAVGLLPLSERFSAFAKLGESYAHTRDSSSATGGNNGSNSFTREWRANPKVGAGLQFLVTHHVGVRGAWERYRIGDGVSDHGNVDAWFVSLIIKMGRTPAPMTPVAVAP